MNAAAPSMRLVGDQLWERLGGTVGETVDTTGAINLYRGRVTAPPLDPDGTVHAYAVLYDTPGHRSGSRAGSLGDRLDGTFQVTAVGGDTTRCLWCVDQVVPLFVGAALTVAGRVRPVRVVEDESNASRSVIVDEDVSPARFYVPLLFRLRI